MREEGRAWNVLYGLAGTSTGIRRIFRNSCNLVKERRKGRRRQTKPEKERKLEEHRGRRWQLSIVCVRGNSSYGKFLNSRLEEWLSTCETCSAELPRKPRPFAYEQGPMGWLARNFHVDQADMHARTSRISEDASNPLDREGMVATPRRSDDSRDYGLGAPHRAVP